MEDLNKYMKSESIDTLSALKEMVQKAIDTKEEYLKLEDVTILNVVDEQDKKKVISAYKEAIERNNLVINLIVECKNIIFRINLIKKSIDRNIQVGQLQIKQLEYYKGLLNDIVYIMNEEKSKLDRVVRYNEKTFTYWSNF